MKLFTIHQNRIRRHHWSAGRGLHGAQMGRDLTANITAKIPCRSLCPWLGSYGARWMQRIKTFQRVCAAMLTHRPDPAGKNIIQSSMKFRYKNLIGLLALIALVALMFALHIITGTAAFVLVALYQLTALAVSKYHDGVFCSAGLSSEQVKEFESLMEQLKLSWDEIKSLPKTVDELRKQVNAFKKSGLGGVGHSGVRWVGNVPFVTDDCAGTLTSIFVMQASMEKGFDQYIPDEAKRKRLVEHAKTFMGVQQRAGGALSPTDIPLPTIYMPQIVELVFAYGAARQYATVFPLGAGMVKLPRLLAGEDQFAYLGAGTAGISQAIPEKEVEAALVTFTANKMGGIIRIPTELEEDTFIALGQFLARYIARQFAKMEDTTLFMADGSGTYANITGVGTYCTENPAYLHLLSAGKTVPTDATINDFRALRALVNPAVLFNMAANGQTQAAYYLHPSMEALLVTFNTIGQPLIYRPQSNGQPATLDGFPIRWIGVSQPYSLNAAPNTFMAFFGDLSFWYLGERGTPRVEISREVFFTTDELAMRALERIDVEAMAIDAMAAMQLPPG